MYSSVSLAAQLIDSVLFVLEKEMLPQNEDQLLYHMLKALTLGRPQIEVSLNL